MTIRSSGRFPCPVCARECPHTEASRHHVLPKSQGGREVAVICKECHRQIHALFGVKEIAGRFQSLEELKATPEMQTWIRWIRKRRPVEARTRHGHL